MLFCEKLTDGAPLFLFGIEKLTIFALKWHHFQYP
jgi:hypothetical protein